MKKNKKLGSVKDPVLSPNTTTTKNRNMLEKLDKQQLIEIINKQQEQLNDLRAQREVFKEYLHTINAKLTKLQEEKQIKKAEKIKYSNIWEQLKKFK